jgi:hypothetical protein
MYTDNESRRVRRIMFPVSDTSIGYISSVMKAFPEDTKIWQCKLSENKLILVISHHTFPETEYTVNEVLNNKNIPISCIKYIPEMKQHICL